MLLKMIINIDLKFEQLLINIYAFTNVSELVFSVNSEFDLCRFQLNKNKAYFKVESNTCSVFLY